MVGFGCRADRGMRRPVPPSSLHFASASLRSKRPTHPDGTPHTPIRTTLTMAVVPVLHRADLAGAPTRAGVWHE